MTIASTPGFARRPLLALFTLLLMMASTPPLTAATADHCAQGESPRFILGFAALAADMGWRAGDPVECEHYDGAGNAYQRTTRGMLYYDKTTNRTSFIPAGVATEGVSALPTTDELIARLGIPALRRDRFGRTGVIDRVRTIESNSAFTRYEIAFDSDGLRVGGFMSIPQGRGPFPVVIVNHGYMPTRSYQTLTYTTSYADVLARAGYLVIHPNYRNHQGSEYGENPYRIGYARDVLHLIGLAQRLPEARKGRVGLWGHSMGGGISLRALTVSNRIAAAVLYAPVSGDESVNWEHWGGHWARRYGSSYNLLDNARLNAAVSSINYLDEITAPIAIHHGTLDSQVPYAWSVDLAERLEAAGVEFDFYAYRGANHNFQGDSRALFNQRVIAFFDEHMR